MDALKTITVSKSKKIQLERLGGPKYESVELFECESDQIPSTFDYDECQKVHQELLDRVNKRIEMREQQLAKEIAGASAPF